MAQRNKYWPVNQKVASLIPSHGTCLGCGPGPQLSRERGNQSMYLLQINVSLPLFLPPFPSLSKKQNKTKQKKQFWRLLSARSRCWPICLPQRALALHCRCCLLSLPWQSLSLVYARKEEITLSSSCYQAANPITRAPPSKLT